MSTLPNANAPVDVKIGLPTRIPSQDPNRAGKYDLVFPVEYGPFSRTTVFLPEETATPDMVNQVVRDTIGKFKQLGGRSIQV